MRVFLKYRILPVAIFYASFMLSVTSSTSVSFSEKLGLVKDGIQELLEKGTEPSKLKDLAYSIPVKDVLNREIESGETQAFVCDICKMLGNHVIQLIRNGGTANNVTDVIGNICVILGIGPNKQSCYSFVSVNADIVMYIVNNKKNLDVEWMCGVRFPSTPCHKPNNYNWTITIPAGYSKIKSQEQDGVTGRKKKRTFEILQLSDIHYDPLYTPNGNALCGQELCCQPDQGPPTSPNNACGYWLDYRVADPPLHTVKEVLKQSSSHKAKYVYYTGDFVSHRYWSTTSGYNAKSIKEVIRRLKETFDVPVYAILGNHETKPFNAYATDDVQDHKLSTQWLFQLMSEQLSCWITEEAKRTILKGGYYTVVPEPGFRVVALNNNVCYTSNWWLFLNDYDPYGQLQWLVQVLEKAERNKETVHLLYHMPTGGRICHTPWSSTFTKIITRFADTITGQFNGHTHKDEFYIFYNVSKQTQAVNVAYNGGSITAYINNNPSYKLYQVDASTYKIQDLEEWTFKLTAANLRPNDKIGWYKLYSFKKAYDVNNMEPSELDNFVVRLAKNATLLETYNNYKNRMGREILKGCGDLCNIENLCRIVTTTYNDQSHCDLITKIYEDNRIK